ncbi:AraC-type DNA-binding protein [Chryseobacterium soldanellicola]|uniref:AraC-type DNA-binding protein n=1 Tax=Chryseobacterium soldanellicola TaxID=311333 RepID=A0A1H1FUP5_9FLAO|nr:tetratricopeptide repeat protein [Chryseobacterium soldanellicola]SDR04236.1 AraC-type DNA-binding protein [Chryseobacterium soldanellicola]
MKLLTLLFVFFTGIYHAQDLAAFNAIYTKTYLETSQKDFDKALKVADSLYSISETPLLQTKSLMLTATLYQQAGNFEKAINYALQSEKIIENTDNAIWKARVYGFLSSQYRFIGLFEKSKKYFEIGLNTAKDITNPEVANNTKAMMMQEMAYNNIGRRKFQSSIENAKKAEEYTEKTTSSKQYLTITNEQLLGCSYYNVGKFEESFRHYQKALEMSKNTPENYMTALIHSGLTLLYVEKKDLKKAKEHLDITLRIAEESKNPSLKNEVYNTSEKYYAATKDLEDYVQTKEKHDTVKKILQKNQQLAANKSYSKIDKENVEIKRNDSSKTIIIFIIVLLFLIGIILFIRYRKIQRLNIEHFKKITKELDEKRSVPLPVVAEMIEEEESQSISQRMMSSETEQRILDFLQKFEESKLFTNNSVSLSYLATYCETNSRYLSYIINTHKDGDFNNYINTLRINYVITNLRNNPLYRKYKLATLAEDAGFSSANKFSLIFKKVTSFSPSTFIKYLNEEGLQDQNVAELREV